MSQARQRRVWLVGAALVLNLGLGGSYVGLWLREARADLFWRADFTAYYTAASMVRAGHGAAIYDERAAAAAQEAVLGGRRFEEGLLPFLTPPQVALALVPLTFLPLRQAFWLWS